MTGSGRVLVGHAEQLEQLPAPGDILVYDFRPDGAASRTAGAEWPDRVGPTIKCVQWNIERGYKLDAVIEALQRQQADIVCLQELDIGCERSGGRNCAFEIALGLQMRCAFATEYEELWSPRRQRAAQGGGVHGNAILSRFDFEPRAFAHTHQPVDWEGEGAERGQPRRGQRLVLAADVAVPGLAAPVLVYSLHLEVFCGIFGRLRQFGDVLADARRCARTQPYQLIFGDLNTMAHGIARFSPIYCSDKLRWLSIGYAEAQWWQRYVLSVTTAHGDSNALLARLHGASLTAADTRALVNPHFVDPFCLTTDTTLRGYLGLFVGKLDWTLLRGWHVLAKGMDNAAYAWSDHKLLHVVLRPVLPSDDSAAVRAYALLQRSAAAPPLRNVWRPLLFAASLSIALLSAGYLCAARLLQ